MRSMVLILALLICQASWADHGQCVEFFKDPSHDPSRRVTNILAGLELGTVWHTERDDNGAFHDFLPSRPTVLDEETNRGHVELAMQEQPAVPINYSVARGTGGKLLLKSDESLPAEREMVAALKLTHHMPSAHTILLLPELDGQNVPAFDGVEFGESEPVANISLKTYDYKEFSIKPLISAIEKIRTHSNPRNWYARRFNLDNGPVRDVRSASGFKASVNWLRQCFSIFGISQESLRPTKLIIEIQDSNSAQSQPRTIDSSDRLLLQQLLAQYRHYQISIVFLYQNCLQTITAQSISPLNCRH